MATQGDVVGGEIGELYRTLAKPLERIVRGGVQAPEPVIEDACQFAWARLVHHRTRVRRDTVLAWLVMTARHEAFKLLGHRRHELSLDDGDELTSADPRPGPSDICEQRERLRGLSSLSLRQQRLLWLYGLGLSYQEIAIRDGCTPRAVERQLQRARTRLRMNLGR